MDAGAGSKRRSALRRPPGCARGPRPARPARARAAPARVCLAAPRVMGVGRVGENKRIQRLLTQPQGVNTLARCSSNDIVSRHTSPPAFHHALLWRVEGAWACATRAAAPARGTGCTARAASCSAAARRSAGAGPGSGPRRPPSTRDCKSRLWRVIDPSVS